MIQTTDFYMVVCDNCKDTYMDEQTDFCYFPDAGSASSSAEEDYWYCVSQHELPDLHFCPKCCTHTEDDKLLIKGTDIYYDL